MNEEKFLQSYDPAEFDRPSVTVDLVLMTVQDGGLAVLLQQRHEHPYLGDWALPGGFVGIDEGLDEAAQRVLQEKTGLSGGWLEQLFSFGAPKRDPRMRIITVAYFALVPAKELTAALARRPDLELPPLDIAWPGEQGGAVTAIGAGSSVLPLAFDHAKIIGHAVKRLRGKLDYSPIGFSLLPELFTLRELQDVHEAILATTLNKPAFRRRMLDKNWILGTGEKECGTSYRPAELYRLNTPEVH